MKENGALRLPEIRETTQILLDLRDFSDQDNGVYICRDSVSGNQASITVVHGEISFKKILHIFQGSNGIGEN